MIAEFDCQMMYSAYLKIYVVIFLNNIQCKTKIVQWEF